MATQFELPAPAAAPAPAPQPAASAAPAPFVFLKQAQHQAPAPAPAGAPDRVALVHVSLDTIPEDHCVPSSPSSPVPRLVSASRAAPTTAIAAAVYGTPAPSPSPPLSASAASSPGAALPLDAADPALPKSSSRKRKRTPVKAPASATCGPLGISFKFSSTPDDADPGSYLRVTTHQYTAPALSRTASVAGDDDFSRPPSRLSLSSSNAAEPRSDPSDFSDDEDRYTQADDDTEWNSSTEVTPRPKAKKARKSSSSRSKSSSAANAANAANAAAGANRKQKACSCCGTTNTPLWRDILKTLPLCNACGIRYKKYHIVCETCSYVPCKQERDSRNCKRCGSVLTRTPLPKRP